MRCVRITPMTNIGLDAGTEDRKNSRLPKTIIEKSTPIHNLEHYTGADLILLEEDILSDSIDDSPLQQARLRKMTRNGILVQRKTERDVCNSIPVLKEHLSKMQKWCSFCWLAVEGHVTRTPDGKTMVLKREKHYGSGKVFVMYENTGWDYNAYLAAILKWQLRGGYFLPVPNSDAWEPALVTLSQVVCHLREEPEKTIIGREKVQNLVLGDRQLDTVASLPGLGGKRAPEVWNQYKNLAQLLVGVCDPYRHIAGIGDRGRFNIRNYMGLTQSQKLALVDVDEVKGEKKGLGDEPNF